jgi:hypothetical protein
MMVENRKEEGWERESWTGQIAPAVEIHHRHVLHHVGNGSLLAAWQGGGPSDLASWNQGVGLEQPKA